MARRPLHPDAQSAAASAEAQSAQPSAPDVQLALTKVVEALPASHDLELDEAIRTITSLVGMNTDLRGHLSHVSQANPVGLEVRRLAHGEEYARLVLDPLDGVDTSALGLYLFVMYRDTTNSSELDLLQEANFLQRVVSRVRAYRKHDDKDWFRHVAERIDAAVPEPGPDPWDELVGPFYTTRSLMKLRHVSRQAIHKMRDSHRLLSVKTSDRKVLYPDFQFGENFEPLPHLSDIVAALGPGFRDGWSTALWLVGPVEAWSGQSAVDKLRSHDPHDLEDVLVLAREAAATRGGK